MDLQAQYLKRLLRPLKKPIQAGIGKAFGGPVPILKYIPEAYGQPSFAVPKQHRPKDQETDDDLAVPPRPFWIGYGSDFGDKGQEWYISRGKGDVGRMLEIVGFSGLSLAQGGRVLEMGCAAGRMIRHLKSFSDACEIWGVDVNAPLINWCKGNLSPPFHFATTTTIPHLPFQDGYFDLIYTGSVFTHIDDLADAWLLELRRVLSPRGRVYITIHDRHTIKLLKEGYHYDKTGYFTSKDSVEVSLTAQLSSDPIYRNNEATFGMLAIGRDFLSQVFYDIDYFRKVAGSMFDVLSVTEEAYGHQTAVLLGQKQHRSPWASTNSAI